jgi:hypothetical protein
MKHKIKIVKTPEKYGTGGLITGDQSNYGLYRGGGHLQDYMTGTEPSDSDVREYYQEEPSADSATIEAEKGELVKDSTGLYKIGGKKHSKGGTKLNVEEGAYVFSDYISVPKVLKEALDFDSSSEKKKDNTVAKLLARKVDAKDYNRLNKILQDSENGKYVDPFEYNTAVNRLPAYDNYISKAALAGELSKAMQNKPYQIPEIGIPALEALTGQTPSRKDSVSDQPMVKAKYGGQLDQYQTQGQVKKKKFNVNGKEVDASYAEANSIPAAYNPVANVPNLYYAQNESMSPGVGVGRATGGRQAPSEAYYNKTIVPMLKKGVNPDELLKNKWIGPAYYDRAKKDYVAPITSAYEDYLFTEDPNAPPPQTTPPTGGNENPRPPDFPFVPFKSNPPGIRTPRIDDDSFDYTTGRKMKMRPYLQDITTALDIAGRRYTDVPPSRIRITGASIDPAFVQPYVYPIQSVAAQQSRDAALYARNPQAQSSVFAGIQGATLPAILQQQAAVNAQNISTDMGARQFNAQSYLQTQAADAQLRKDYMDDVAKFISNKDRSRISRSKAAKDAFNNMWTNMGNTSLINQRFPQEAFDPLTYQTYFKPGSGRTADELFSDNQLGSSSQDDFSKVYESVYASLPASLSDKLREQEALKKTNEYFNSKKSRVTTKSNSKYPYSKGYDISSTRVLDDEDGYDYNYKGGGFIPIYRTMY